MAGPTMSRLNVVTKAGDVTDLATGPHGLAVQLDAKFWVTSEAMLQSPGQILFGPTANAGQLPSAVIRRPPFEPLIVSSWTPWRRPFSWGMT